MARQLMPKSGIMMPYVVVSRDAAVVGVSTVDGLAGAIDLTKKYMKITDADAKYAVKSNVYTKAEVQGLLSPIMEGALFKDDPFVNNNTAIRSGGGNNVESVDMIKVNPENEIILGDYSSGVQGVKIHTKGNLELIDVDDGGSERVDTVYTTAYRPETSQVPFAAIGSYVLDSQGRTVGVNKTGVNSDIKQLTGLTTPLSLNQGGTGGNSLAAAKSNLQVDRIAQWPDRTSIRPPNLKYNMIVADSGVWGVYEEGTNVYQPLRVEQGGTGALTANGAREKLYAAGTGVTNTFSQYQIIQAQEGLHLKKAANQGNTWLAFEGNDNVVRHRIGMEGENLSFYSYSNTGAAGRKILQYSYTDNKLSTPTSIFNASGGFEARDMEIGKNNPNLTTYIDLHYSGKYDYDARITCDGMNADRNGGGNLRLLGGFIQLNGNGTGTSVIGNRFNVQTTDAVFNTQAGFAGGALQIPAAAGVTAPVGAGLRGIYAGADSANFTNASNINLYSWYGIGFCTAYTSPTNGVVQGKPAVYINTRDGTLNAKGAVQANGVTLTSDKNSKENINVIDPEDALNKIERLDGYSFKYKQSDSDRLTAGVIAQELEEVIPDLVIKPKPVPIYDESGKNVVGEEEQALTADYMGLIGYLVAAVKGAKQKEDALEKRIQVLEDKLNSLIKD